MTEKGTLRGLVLTAQGMEREVLWVRTMKGGATRVDSSGVKIVFVYAPTEFAAVRAAHRAGLRAVKKRGASLAGIVGAWPKLAQYQFEKPAGIM